MEEADFLNAYKSLLSLALESGARSGAAPRKTNHVHRFDNETHRRRFLAACHRGYVKAQERILKSIIDLHNDDSLTDEEKLYRQILYRKIIDSIAFAILQVKSHMVRRLVLHDFAPAINIEDAMAIGKYVASLNNESRQTFALMADLSTFIHVADVLRVDFRPGETRVALIEVKTGHVNTMLLSQLEKYKPAPESLSLLEKDSSIEGRYLSQAKRMLRQKIRLAQTLEVLTTDEGIDIQLGRPIMLTKKEIEVETYDEILDELCDEAKQSGAAAVSIQHCLHLGAGYSEEPITARQEALRAVNFGAYSHWQNPIAELADVRSELLGALPENKLFRVMDLLRGNLFSRH